MCKIMCYILKTIQKWPKTEIDYLIGYFHKKSFAYFWRIYLCSESLTRSCYKNIPETTAIRKSQIYKDGITLFCNVNECWKLFDDELAWDIARAKLNTKVSNLSENLKFKINHNNEYGNVTCCIEANS